MRRARKRPTIEPSYRYEFVSHVDGVLEQIRLSRVDYSAIEKHPLCENVIRSLRRDAYTTGEAICDIPGGVAGVTLSESGELLVDVETAGPIENAAELARYAIARTERFRTGAVA